jgi:hypothetical protein
MPKQQRNQQRGVNHLRGDREMDVFVILKKLLLQVAGLFTPEMTKEGFREYLNKVIGVAGIIAGWTPPEWDDETVVFLSDVVNDDEIYGVIWDTIDAIFNNGGDEAEAMVSAQGRLEAMETRAGFPVLEIIALIKAIIEILKQFFNK